MNKRKKMIRIVFMIICLLFSFVYSDFYSSAESYVEMYVVVKRTSASPGSTSIYDYFYDKNGLLARTETDDGSSFNYTYKIKNGNIVEKSSTEINSYGDEKNIKEIFSYDSKGRVLKLEYKSNDKSENHIVKYKYDKNNRTTKCTTIYPGMVSYKHSYKYSYNSRKKELTTNTKMVTMFANSKKGHKTVQKNKNVKKTDNKGNVIKYSYTNGNIKNRYEYELKYNKAGQLNKVYCREYHGKRYGSLTIKKIFYKKIKVPKSYIKLIESQQKGLTSY